MASNKVRDGAVSSRLDREEWLARALEVLGKQGAGELTVESLARQLGVTKGSFYWHFKDRANYFRQLIEYWDEFFTQTVIAEISTRDSSPTCAGVQRSSPSVKVYKTADIYDKEQALVQRVQRVNGEAHRTVTCPCSILYLQPAIF